MRVFKACPGMIFHGGSTMPFRFGRIYLFAIFALSLFQFTIRSQYFFKMIPYKDLVSVGFRFFGSEGGTGDGELLSACDCDIL